MTTRLQRIDMVDSGAASNRFSMCVLGDRMIVGHSNDAPDTRSKVYVGVSPAGEIRPRLRAVPTVEAAS